MLRRIRIPIDRLRDRLSQPRLLGEPFTAEPADRMPANTDGAEGAGDVGVIGGNHVRAVPETEGLFDCDLAFQHSLCKALFPGRVRKLQNRVCQDIGAVWDSQVRTHFTAF